MVGIRKRFVAIMMPNGMRRTMTTAGWTEALAMLTASIPTTPIRSAFRSVDIVAVQSSIMVGIEKRDP
jgi:hypothetical protein